MFHKYFWKHDRHIILSSSKKAEDDQRNGILMTGLLKAFPGRKEQMEMRCMRIEDVIDLEKIKTKVETLLSEFREDEIDIYFSPGTSIMQLAWFICHTKLGYKTRLLQTRPARFSKDKSKPELLEIKMEQSSFPVTAIIKESLLSGKREDTVEDYKMTESLMRIYDKADKAAQTDYVTCLITGETGTGKEHLARYIHEKSARKNKHFIPVNCSAMGDQLLESRLFGYKKGSFTGADKDTEGLFKQADGGTIYLDEIGDISPYMQQVLLRVIQEKEIGPIGGKAEKIDVRVVSATHKNLREMCGKGEFRWDLFYRLQTVELELPPLRERGISERKEMMQYFLKKKKKQMRKENVLELSDEVSDFMLAYHFPGNIRELENLIESLYVFCNEKVELKDLPKWIKEMKETKSFKWKDVEKDLIIRVLKMNNGNQKKTFETIGYGSINTFRDRLREYNIKAEEFKL